MGFSMGMERVLVVDEATSNTLFFEMLLKELGFTDIFIASTGYDGIKSAENNHPQLIIVAWEMGAMPGTIFIQKVKERKKRKHLPCLVYSKRMSGEDVLLTKELGFKDILAMPFDRESARNIIKGIIDNEANLNPIEAQIRKIENYLAEGRPSEALKLITPKLSEKNPFVVRANTCIAEVWMRLMKYDKSETFLSMALKEDADYFPALQLKAKLYSKMGNHAAAIDILRKMAEKSPKNLSNLVNLGAVYVDANQVDEAKKVLDRVMDLDADNRGAKDELGKVAFKEGNIPLAAQFLAETENGDEIASFFNMMAISLVAQGKHQEGVQTYRNAMQLLADKARLYLLHYNLGLALKKGGKIQEGFAELCQSYLLEPTYEKAYVAIARVAKEMKEKNVALDKKLVTQVKEKRAIHKPDPDKAKGAA